MTKKAKQPVRKKTSKTDWRQREIIEEFEKFLGTNAAETAIVLGVSYSTYMKWRIGSRSMGAVAKRCMSYAQFIVRAGLELPLKQAIKQEKQFDRKW